MDKDTKILLMAVVIILVALVSFNYADLTGDITKSGTSSMKVSPSTITFIKYQTKALITIELLVNEPVENEMYLYKVGSGKVGNQKITLCRSSTCSQADLEKSYNYYLNSDLRDGIYYFVARGRQFNNIVATSNKFTIVHKN